MHSLTLTARRRPAGPGTCGIAHTTSRAALVGRDAGSAVVVRDAGGVVTTAPPARRAHPTRATATSGTALTRPVRISTTTTTASPSRYTTKGR